MARESDLPFRHTSSQFLVKTFCDPFYKKYQILMRYTKSTWFTPEENIQVYEGVMCEKTI